MLVYVSGPYTAKTHDEISANIQAAREVAIKLWEMGHAVICPHLNTAHFEVDCNAKYDDYMRGDFELLAVCDAIVMLPNWRDSNGAVAELNYANELGMGVFTAPNLPPLHPTEVRCPQQTKAFREIIGQMYRTHLRKNADYSPANVLLTGEVGLVTRLWDKVARLLNLTGFDVKVDVGSFKAPKTAQNEPIEDAYEDAGVYAIIGRLLRAGKWGK
ncbi:MAG TPA: DUF1937 family protein [Anaerolineales bacterium]|nr:DUF1937 family protein [Anaerolineales bacterium]